MTRIHFRYMALFIQCLPITSAVTPRTQNLGKWTIIQLANQVCGAPFHSALVSATMAMAATVRRGLGVASATEISAGANKSGFALKRNLDSDATTRTGRKGSERSKTRITRPAQ